MKKLVSKLLGCLIAFAPISSFNSNNYSHADIFGNSERTRGVQVMTEKEFKKACAYINEKINDYINRYIDSPLGRKIGYEIFNNLAHRSQNVEKAEISTSFKKKRFNTKTISCQDGDLCRFFNTNLPTFVCRHWVAYFDKNYFSRMNRKYTILKYRDDECKGHIVFLLCYYPEETPTKEKWVVIDPTAQFGCLCLMKSAAALHERNPMSLADEKETKLVRNLYSAVMEIYYTPDSKLLDMCIENNGFLGIPLECYYVFGRYQEPEAYSEIFWTRDQLGFDTHNLKKIGDRENSFDNFLKHIYSKDKLNQLHDLRKTAETSNSFVKLLYGVLCEYVSEECKGIYDRMNENINKKWGDIKETINEKWNKITDKMCLIDLPSDIELSDDDCMGFGS